MSTWMDRLAAEQRELASRRLALSKFIAAPEFENIDPEHQALLVQQADAMAVYYRALKRRIAHCSS
jgi:hypothetical protein